MGVDGAMLSSMYRLLEIVLTRYNIRGMECVKHGQAVSSLSSIWASLIKPSRAVLAPKVLAY